MRDLDAAAPPARCEHKPPLGDRAVPELDEQTAHAALDAVLADARVGGASEQAVADARAAV
jgi:hypothetical protein